MLVDGGMCHWHLRRNGQLTIREIIVAKDRQRQGIGIYMISELMGVAGATSLFAKCPADLPANSWYEHWGFRLEGTGTTKTGKVLNLWRYPLYIARAGSGTLLK